VFGEMEGKIRERPLKEWLEDNYNVCLLKSYHHEEHGRTL